jgi:hypothetical protein
MVSAGRQRVARAHGRARARRAIHPTVQHQRRRTATIRPGGSVAMRALFLPRSTQHVNSIPSAQEWLGGLIALAAIASWGLLAALLAG